MKIIWETEDIKTGRRFGHPTSSEGGIIGYDSREEDGQSKYVLVSLSDGMIICAPTTKFLIAKLLSDEGYQPAELLAINNLKAVL